MHYLNCEVDDFCTWLCEHELDVVGLAGTWFDSPLARWISECSGHQCGVYGASYSRASCDDVQWLLPRWAYVFATYLEHLGTRPMTGSDALIVLAQVELLLVSQEANGGASGGSGFSRL